MPPQPADTWGELAEADPSPSPPIATVSLTSPVLHRRHALSFRLAGSVNVWPVENLKTDSWMLELPSVQEGAQIPIGLLLRGSVCQRNRKRIPVLEHCSALDRPDQNGEIRYEFLVNLDSDNEPKRIR
jgi:hypothetical protein